ncbi:hypothetical protein HPB52_015622 [Rhipicephalus sanguineus]|uniref:PPM-type phosphatase domain-containing protein n=1 Tax=Rhipicephalus sanguineus TaxID=34632 RepID=A0A9D4QAC8_RHISA|nr:hypothetical protein HPB52_015622 [Rhipicephalus sanguineus]
MCRGPSKRRLFSSGRMGAFLDKPKVEKHTEGGQGNGLRYALASMQGWRVEMEDAHCAMVGLPCGLDRWSFFAVFDGHAGARVSAHCAQNLLDAIIQTDDGNFYGLEIIELVYFAHCLNPLKVEAVGKVDRTGSTAVCALVSPSHVYFANCGDSRALLCRNGQPAFTTRDHKPINPGEKERIQRAGGSVMIQRVNGSLAVSRALGDFEYKQVGPCHWFVVHAHLRGLPSTQHCRDHGNLMINEELCQFVHHQLCISHDLEELCAAVIDICLYRGSKDNMSIVLVLFPGAPSVSDEALQHDRELNQLIEKRITGK